MSTGVTAPELQGRNAFHALAALGSVKQASKLLSTTPKRIVITNLMEKDLNGRTPLHLAAYFGHIRVLKTFLEASPEAGDIRDSDGNTARDALRRPQAPVLGDPEFHRNFRRLVKIDKTGYEFLDFGKGNPLDIWDVAMSSKTSVVVTYPALKSADDKAGDHKSVYCLMNNEIKHLDLGPEHSPRFVSTSNVHSLIITSDRCFAWGKNKGGVLGLNVDEKVLQEPRMLDYYFGGDDSDNDSRHFNAFSALNHGSGSGATKDPLIGVACCDFYSCCYSTTKLWCWGTNRGQMMNRAPVGAVVSEPELIFEPGNRIRSVACCDSALLVLTTNGQIHVLSGSRATKLVIHKSSAVTAESLTAKGNFLVVQTSQRKLIRLRMPSGAGKPDNNVEDTLTTVWIPRKPKDEINTFDVGENGTVIIATKSGIFKIEDGREIQELKNLKGMPITTICTDSLCKSSVAVCNIDASLTFCQDRNPIMPRYGMESRDTLWESQEAYDCRIDVQDEDQRVVASVGVHSAVLYARCPTLRGLIEGSSSRMIATPSGSSLLLTSDNTTSTLLVRNAPVASVREFVKFLYANIASDDCNAATITDLSPTQLHEYNALKRLATRSLGPGLWEARLAGIGCDATLESGTTVHSAVLRSASPVLAAQSNRWPNSRLDCPALSSDPEIEEVIIKYAYTSHLDPSSSKSTSLQERASWLFALWQAGDELLISGLSTECERNLFKMIDLDLVIPFLTLSTHSPYILNTRLYSALLDIVVRNLAFFTARLCELDSRSLEVVENLFISIEGSELPDKTLAEAFEDLKTRLSSGSSTPNTAKKKHRAVSIPSTASPTSSPDSASSLSRASSSLESLSLKSQSPSHDPIRPLSPSDDKLSGWIQTKKKGRTGSSNHGSDKTPIKSVLSSSRGSTPGSAKSSASLTFSSPSVNSPWSANAATNNRASLRNSANGSTSELVRSPPSYASAALSASAPVSASSSTTSLPNLPKLGESLPRLGDPVAKTNTKSRTKSSAGKSKPKFDSKSTIQFDSPFSMAQQMQKATAQPDNPWKQVPKIVQTSSSVLEKLEREHQINSRRLAGQSVWGIKN